MRYNYSQITISEKLKYLREGIIAKESKELV